MTEYKTLREWGVKEWDVVERRGGARFTVRMSDGRLALKALNGEWGVDVAEAEARYTIISRATPAPKLWRDMTPAEKGALLLAAHEGKMIECCDGAAWWKIRPPPVWRDGTAYRVRPEPVVEVVDLLIPGGVKIGTVALRDGKPDPASVKVEERLIRSVAGWAVARS